MFENILHQRASVQLRSDFQGGILPRSMLFAGNEASGKLTTALELARVVNCAAGGSWGCECSSCNRHKALVSADLLVAGPRSCLLEIAAAKYALLNAVVPTAALRFLFVRAVRKLTARFNPVLWEGDDRAAKSASLVGEISENLEELECSFPADKEALEKLCGLLETAAGKLEGMLYESLPVDHVRNVASWARYTQEAGLKVVVLEGAERMQEGVRNALLKILEEPPEQTLFVLTTSRRQAIMPTILSRCRTYWFEDRSAEAQKEILSRIFHADPASSGVTEINAYFQTFLPASVETVRSMGYAFIRECLDYQGGALPSPPVTKFEPKILLTLFFQGLYEALSPRAAAAGFFPRFCENAAFFMEKIRDCYSRITIYNQAVGAALENLAWEICHGEH